MAGTKRSRVAAKSSFSHLPFFASGKRGEKACFWNITESGDVRADNETGRAFARQAIAAMFDSNSPVFAGLDR
jgi:hypothetical protein